MIIRIGQDPAIIDQGRLLRQTNDISIKSPLFFQGRIPHPDYWENTSQENRINAAFIKKESSPLPRNASFCFVSFSNLLFMGKKFNECLGTGYHKKGQDKDAHRNTASIPHIVLV